MGKDKHSLKLKKHKGGKGGKGESKSSASVSKTGRFQKAVARITNVFTPNKSVKNISNPPSSEGAITQTSPPAAAIIPAATPTTTPAETPTATSKKTSAKITDVKSKSTPSIPTTVPSANPITMNEDIIVNNPEAPGGKGMLMDVFSNIFNVLAAIGLIMLGAVFVFSIADIIRYTTKWSVQTFLTYFFSKDIFNKETIEMQLLEYHKNDSKEEPYTIFLQQYLAKGMFILGAFAFVIGVIQICVYALLLLYFKLRENPNHGERLTFNGKAALIIFLTAVCAVLLYVTYTFWFQKTLQKKIVNSYNTVTDITNKIYNNMTNNSKFITNLVNSSEKQEGIQENIAIMNSITGEGKIEELAKMIFTISTYNYFKNIIPGKDEENYNNVIKPMFIQKEASTLFPSDYMYYLQNMFIPNDYPNIINHIFGQDKAIKSKEEDILLLKKLNEIFTNVNTTSKHIYRLPKNVPMMFWYFIVNTIIVVVLVGTIIIVYGNTFKKIYNDFLIKPCNSISQYLLKKDICFPFTNIPVEEPKNCEESKPAVTEPAGSIKITTSGPSQSSSSAAALKPTASISKPPNKEEEQEKALGSKETKEPDAKQSTTSMEQGSAQAQQPKEQEQAPAEASPTDTAQAPTNWKTKPVGNLNEIAEQRRAKVATAPTNRKTKPVGNLNETAEQRTAKVATAPTEGGKKNKKSKRKHK